MRKHLRAFLVLLSGFSAILLTGCGSLTGNEDGQQLPWSQPADWEGTAPGMPTTPGSR